MSLIGSHTPNGALPIPALEQPTEARLSRPSHLRINAWLFHLATSDDPIIALLFTHHDPLLSWSPLRATDWTLASKTNLRLGSSNWSCRSLAWVPFPTGEESSRMGLTKTLLSFSGSAKVGLLHHPLFQTDHRVSWQHQHCSVSSLLNALFQNGIMCSFSMQSANCPSGFLNNYKHDRHLWLVLRMNSLPTR